jgi:prephenate dehydratase
LSAASGRDNIARWLQASEEMASLTVSFQGERGAFSEEAAYQLLGPRIRLLPCESFSAVFESVARGRAQRCLVPIENTLAGPVYENYDLLLSNRLHIIAETNLRIVHNLIAFPETSPKNLCKVYSHPVALAQCGKFFSKHPGVEKVTFYDTAGSVKMLADERLPGAAAIASRTAAKVYRARILQTHLEDHHENYTRFLLLAKKPVVSPRANKVSIVFSTRNVPGALFKCLSVFALRDIDLSKLESRPLRGKPWEYMFYVDFIGSTREDRCQKALAHLAEVTSLLRVLGCYPRAK